MVEVLVIADSLPVSQITGGPMVFCTVPADGPIVCRVNGRDALWFDTESTAEVADIVRKLCGEHIGLGFEWEEGADLDR